MDRLPGVRFREPAHVIVLAVRYLRVLRVTGRKGWLVIMQHLIIIGAGRNCRTSVLGHPAFAGSLCRFILQIRTSI